MHISPVTQPPAAALPARLDPSAVSAAALKRANGDGDGRSGAAALNDGDSAATAAAREVRPTHIVDVKA